MPRNMNNSTSCADIPPLARCFPGICVCVCDFVCVPVFVCVCVGHHVFANYKKYRLRQVLATYNIYFRECVVSCILSVFTFDVHVLSSSFVSIFQS